MLLAAIAVASPGLAQQGWSQGGTPQRSSAMCARLEGQLSALDRGGGEGALGEQIRRYEDTAQRQQAELDRLTNQARRAGCEGVGFFLFGGQPAQCDGLNAQIQRMRANIDRINADLQRLQRGGPDLGDQRRAILIALAQNDCGPQYRAAMPQRPRGLFESLFGAPSVTDYGTTESAQSSTYRTICVRTCDGFYFPISFATVQSRFSEDEAVCQRMCPASEVSLYAHRNPGEEVSQAVSLAGRSYRDLPNAFRYRTEYNAACSCRQPGQSWAEALGAKDSTVEKGDIVVTDERSKAMARPEATRSGAAKGSKKGAAPPAPEPVASTPEDRRSTVRAVGPTHYPKQ